jgi:glycosyltransferase involved in cell wall biosynthesis
MLPKLIKIDNSKPFLVVMAPFGTRSGYGEHSRDIIKSLIKSNKYDIGLIGLNWGITPINALDKDKDQDIIDKIIYDMSILQSRVPDIFIHITIPNEFVRGGKFNIGITAGIESTIAKPEWIEGINRMDLNLVPSKFTKDVLLESVYSKQNEQKQIVGELRVSKPIEVLFEGSNTDIFNVIEADKYLNVKSNIKNELDSVKEEFLFLNVGHWLQGDHGHDRKDTGATIQLFLDVFKDKKIKNKPALVIKTSSATFSIKDRIQILDKINEIKKIITLEPGEKLPNIYLLHGDLSEIEMNELYNHPKIKSLVSLTKGEGYGRPLQEFAFTGKPVIVSNWSAQVDFIKPEYHTLLSGEVKQIHPSTMNDFMVKESGWFYVDYQVAGNALTEMFNNYTTHRVKAKAGLEFLTKEKTLSKMQEELLNILDNKETYTVQQVAPTIQLPKLNLPKLNLPKLETL